MMNKEQSEIWRAWLVQYRKEAADTLRDFGVEITHDEIERMVREDVVATLRQYFRDALLRAFHRETGEST